MLFTPAENIAFPVLLEGRKNSHLPSGRIRPAVQMQVKVTLSGSFPLAEMSKKCLVSLFCQYLDGYRQLYTLQEA